MVPFLRSRALDHISPPKQGVARRDGFRNTSYAKYIIVGDILLSTAKTSSTSMDKTFDLTVGFAGTGCTSSDHGSPAYLRGSSNMNWPQQAGVGLVQAATAAGTTGSAANNRGLIVEFF